MRPDAPGAREARVRRDGLLEQTDGAGQAAALDKQLPGLEVQLVGIDVLRICAVAGRDRVAFHDDAELLDDGLCNIVLDLENTLGR